MAVLQNLLDGNRSWAEGVTSAEPQFFQNLAGGQHPKFLWIGCADSRVPAAQVTGLKPGELFVHRNIANVVVHSDLNCMSVLEYAVAALKVEHVVVCGHYGCGGVQAALGDQRVGVIDSWLRHIRDVRTKHHAVLADVSDSTLALKMMCEFNVIEQVQNVCHTTIVQNAWAAGQELSVHGLIYNLADGLLTNLGTTVTGPEQISPIYRLATST